MGIRNFWIFYKAHREAFDLIESTVFVIVLIWFGVHLQPQIVEHCSASNIIGKNLSFLNLSANVTVNFTMP